MARDAHGSEARRLRLDTASLPTSQPNNDLKVAIVESQAPQLEDVVEGEVLELSAQDDDTPALSPASQVEDSLIGLSLHDTIPSPHPTELRLRGRSLLHAMREDSATESRSRARAHSESDRANFDPVTGQPIAHCRTPVNPQIYRPGQARYPLLQATVDELAYETAANTDNEIQQPTARASTTSTLVPTPIPNSRSTAAQRVLSPLNSSSPVSFPRASGFDSISPPRDIIRRSASGSAMQRSLTSRRTSRRSSARSDQSSMSPASAFLSQWSSSPAAAEPDDEGQQIGDQGEYVIGQQIGFGGFSVIKEVFKLEHGHRSRLAVKIVRKRVAGKDALKNERFQSEVEHEVSIWRHLKHPNVLPLISVFDTPFARFCIMPLTPGGTLLDLVRRFRKASQSPSDASAAVTPQSSDKVMPIALVRKYLYQLARAIRYLHQDLRIVHRDIKLENCLIDNNGTLLLCDFGMAEFYDADARDSTPEQPPSPRGSWDYGSDSENDRPFGSMGPSETSTSITGSLPSASPELIRASVPLYKPSVDMWAYGVICYTLMVGRLPFNHAFAPTLQMMILKGDWDRSAIKLAMQARLEDETATPAAVALVDGCLEINTKRRWIVAKVMSSEFWQLQQ